MDTKGKLLDWLGGAVARTADRKELVGEQQLWQVRRKDESAWPKRLGSERDSKP